MEKRANCPIILVIAFGASTDFRCFYTREIPLYQICIFLTLFKTPLTPLPLRFEHLVDW